MAASSVSTNAVVDWLTLVTILPPPGQTLAGVGTWPRLYAFGLQGAPDSTKTADTAVRVEDRPALKTLRIQK